MAISTARLNAEWIGKVHAASQFLIGLFHLVTRGAKGIRFRQFQAANEAPCKYDASAKRDQSSGRNAQQEPSLRPAPQPRKETAARWNGRVHVRSLKASMNIFSSNNRINGVLELQSSDDDRCYAIVDDSSVR